MKKLIVANWKMNPQSIEEARKLVSAFEHRVPSVSAHTEVIIAVPFVFLPALFHSVSSLKLSAQNCSWQDFGALTGEVSPSQLKLWNVEYVILGHSERRLYLGETDSVVNAKIGAALKHGIAPIVCLGGEAKAVKSEMRTLVTKQFTAVTKDLDKKQLEKIVYVYEPSWAISTMNNSEPASGEHAAEMINHIYDLLEHQVGREAKDIPVLYGGTVNKDNIHEYAKFSEIGGALVGAASLDPENFWEIVLEFNRESIHQ